MSITPMFLISGAFSSNNLKKFDLNEENSVISARDINSQSVQTIDLLNAPLNSNYNLSTGGAEIEIVDSNALVAEKNPSSSGVNRLQNKTDQISIYVVREGDSLSQIAKMFGVSVNTIVWTNDIKHDSLITPGQKLAILPVSGVKYTVKSDDSLSKIVDKYEGDIDEVMEYNNIQDKAEISVGDVIIIPNGHISTPTKYVKNNYATKNADVAYKNKYYIKPVRDAVISQGLHPHNAIDFAVPRGTPILASASGKVIISRDSGRWNGGYGNYIVIKHNNGTQTLYAHTLSNIVYAGQHVVQGQIIGHIGSTGRSTGPHVHFEVRGARNPFAKY